MCASRDEERRPIAKRVTTRSARIRAARAPRTRGWASSAARVFARSRAWWRGVVAGEIAPCLAAARARRGEPWRREAAAAPRAAAGATHAAGISTIVRGASVLAVSRRREVRRRPFPCVVGTRERRKALGRAVRSARGERGARSSASIRKEPPSQEIKSNRAMEKDLACLESQILNLVSQFLREFHDETDSRNRRFANAILRVSSTRLFLRAGSSYAALRATPPGCLPR